jgi:uroporphyrin-III C-methyltransferase/precorrin-2 dehydrogenase/sirohydrochlorin ferrochelatase
MDRFPVFLELKGRPCLVVGGGHVAARKVDLLLKAGGKVTIVAPDVPSPVLAELIAAKRIHHIAEPFAPRHVMGHVVVVAATNHRAVNAAVSRAANAACLPVNVVDDPQLSSFIVPAIVDRGPVTVAISSDGVAPVLARLLRARIEAAIPASIGRLADLAARLRKLVRRQLPDPVRRRRFWEGVFEGRVGALALAGHTEEAEALAAEELARAERSAPLGEVALVGAGPGDPDLMTFAALRLLQSADVVVHDRLVSHDILDLARREAERIDVGKAGGAKNATQEEINTLIVRLAREGKRVVRLKGGDPFLFGRGGEELEALAAEGIAVRVVPGITAAAGCAAYAGIPLTHRDHAHACVFVSGHRRHGAAEPDWAALARPEHTLAIYMGLGPIAEICARLTLHGLDASTPAAAIENGTRPDQRVVTGTLATLPARVAEASVTGPTLIVVGEVVALRHAGAGTVENDNAARSDDDAGAATA